MPFFLSIESAYYLPLLKWKIDGVFTHERIKIITFKLEQFGAMYKIEFIVFVRRFHCRNRRHHHRGLRSICVRLFKYD